MGVSSCSTLALSETVNSVKGNSGKRDCQAMTLTSHESKDQRHRGVERALSRQVLKFSHKQQPNQTKTDRAIDEDVEQLFQKIQAIKVPTSLLLSCHSTYTPGPRIAIEFVSSAITIRGQIGCVFHHRSSQNAVSSRFEAVPGQDPVTQTQARLCRETYHSSMSDMLPNLVGSR